jgi:hypothetical protein
MVIFYLRLSDAPPPLLLRPLSADSDAAARRLGFAQVSSLNSLPSNFGSSLVGAHLDLTLASMALDRRRWLELTSGRWQLSSSWSRLDVQLDEPSQLKERANQAFLIHKFSKFKKYFVIYEFGQKRRSNQLV